MILIEIEKNRISINGHSGYDEIGKDIVCSAVSSIVITTINGISKIYNDVIEYKEDNGVIIKIIKNKKVSDILIDNMIELLSELEKQYPKNIKIRRC